MMLKSFLMLGIICLSALILEIDFFAALPKFGAEHFGAPDDLKEMVKNIPDKPKYVVALGLVILVLAFCAIIAAGVWAVVDTLHNYAGWVQTFLRFLIILWGYKLFDIVVFDWLLLTKIRLPEKLCPETRGAKGYDSFGFNKKSQMTKLVVFLGIAVLAATVFALICG